MFLHYFETKGVIIVSWCNLHFNSLITFIHFQLSGQLLAAYGYGAPEFESGIYTYQSDVYSFGVVMLELLTGRQSYDKWDTLTKILRYLFLAFRGLKFLYCAYFEQKTSSRWAVSCKMGNYSTSWHWCIIKDGWSFSKWSLPCQIIVKFCRHYF